MICRQCGADISHRAAQARFCSITCRRRRYYSDNAELIRRDRMRRYYRSKEQ